MCSEPAGMHGGRGRERGLLVGVDIGGTKTAVIAATPDLSRRERRQFATAEAGGPDGALGSVAELIDETAAAMGGRPLAIGVSCGGPLDSRRGLIQSPPNLPGWDGIDVRGLAEPWGVPIRLMNDANACALAEWRWGAGRGTSSMVFLTFGTGMGAGIVLRGHVYEGANGNAGEVGHMRLAEDGPVGYGKAGSFEGFCSGGGIARAAEAAGWIGSGGSNSGVSARDVAEAAALGDLQALAIMRACGSRLGEGLAILVDLLNPDMVVIGGVFARCRALLWPTASDALLREALPEALSACRVVPAALGEEVGDFSALAVAMSATEAL